jgi:hypothetical protein
MSALFSALARPGATASLGRGGKLGVRSVGRAWGGHAGCRSRASPGVRCVGTEVRVTHPWPRHTRAACYAWPMSPEKPLPLSPPCASRALNISCPTTRDLTTATASDGMSNQAAFECARRISTSLLNLPGCTPSLRCE